jgi:hypothetical protein
MATLNDRRFAVGRAVFGDVSRLQENLLVSRLNASNATSGWINILLSRIVPVADECSRPHLNVPVKMCVIKEVWFKFELKLSGLFGFTFRRR